MNKDIHSGKTQSAYFLRIIAVILLMIGAAMLVGGFSLLSLGGSPYYGIAGLTIVIAAALLWRRDARGAWLYGAVLVATWLWAFWEAGFNGWALIPRVGLLTVLGALILMPWSRRAYGGVEKPWLSGSAWLAAGAVIVVAIATILIWQPGIPKAGSTPQPVQDSTAETEWPAWGNAASGTRHAQADQITPDNVANLEVAWTFETGAAPNKGGAPALAFESTPLKIGDTLYSCTPHNIVDALDAVTGEQLWRFDPEVNETGLAFANCRGLAYTKLDSMEEGAACSERLYMGTIDARLLAIDAATGKLCADFGDNGAIDLRKNLGPHPSIYYYVTSPPVVSGDVVVTGSYGLDGQTIDQPSGVIRAYDLKSGELVWAFDPADPERTTLLEPHETYQPGTPNSWSVSSTDEELGLVYIPFGVATPDYYGGDRSEAAKKFSNTIVALDNRTGLVRWVFQVVHHDIWDYDIASQPVLTDFKVGDKMIPALISISKTGDTFVLDRRTGEPLSAVVEKPVPQNAGPGEQPSPTQPFSVDMPSFAGGLLTEARMWGLTPLDQLWCRIEFKSHRYDGPYTPPSLQGSIQYPGFAGGVNWGSYSVDHEKRLLVVNSLSLPTRSKLITPQEAAERGMAPAGGGRETSPEAVRAGVPQLGARYAVLNGVLMSPLEVPCIQPPYGEISAIDLDSRKIVWRKPLGEADRMGPLGMKSHIPFAIGLPTVGGAMTTSGGLTFIASTPDKRIRAFNTETGELLWRADLPANGNANPMSYIGADGRQYLVIAAGGSGALATNEKNILVAFALPKQ
jgi:membrane-bound PQQ-dependent dehydrogenase (glucose/quinate/shikimate family)